MTIGARRIKDTIGHSHRVNYLVFIGDTEIEAATRACTGLT